MASAITLLCTGCIITPFSSDSDDSSPTEESTTRSSSDQEHNFSDSDEGDGDYSEEEHQEDQESEDYGNSSPDSDSTARTAPKLPANIHEKSKTGAIAAAKYFLDAHYYALSTGNMEPLNRIAETNAPVQQKLRAIRKMLRDYGPVKGAPTYGEVANVQRLSDSRYVVTIAIAGSRSAGEYIVDATFKSDRWRIHDVNGRRTPSRDSQDPFETGREPASATHIQ
ncbi:MAG: DUF6318 family protein [Winkia neuii]|uniref:DUF6318 family protein n=1 Tax=Winkia TaxID=2692118 RepID=UPI001C5E4BD8|nr:DUF6318 family protein [Winkia neuii]MDU5161579.1 DUF6318 family protein [Winkia neuii]